MTNRIFYFLFLQILTFGLFSCSRDPKIKGREIFPDMVHSVAYEAYTTNPLTPSGGTMLEAPKGSISSNYHPFHYEEGPEEAARAGRELINPIEKTPASIARGKRLYENTCLPCHGATGKGDGPIVPKFPAPPLPPSYTGKVLMEYPDGRIYHVIVMGVGAMQSHAAQLDYEDRWNVVNYVKELQKIP